MAHENLCLATLVGPLRLNYIINLTSDNNNLQIPQSLVVQSLTCILPAGSNLFAALSLPASKISVSLHGAGFSVGSTMFCRMCQCVVYTSPRDIHSRRVDLKDSVIACRPEAHRRRRGRPVRPGTLLREGSGGNLEASTTTAIYEHTDSSRQRHWWQLIGMRARYIYSMPLAWQ